MMLVSPPYPPSFPATSLIPSRHRRRIPVVLNCRRSVIAAFSASTSDNVDAFTKYSGYLFELSTSEAESLTEYNISRISAIYKKKPFVLLRRLFQIGTTFGKWFALRYYDSLTERSDLMFEVRAAELRKILVQLGPAYIKIAQAISTRLDKQCQMKCVRVHGDGCGGGYRHETDSICGLACIDSTMLKNFSVRCGIQVSSAKTILALDLIPPAYLDELALLQDQITPFSTEVAFDTIEQELGLPIDALFSEISPVPVAAASLGQVYQARLRPSGKVVAVKVQRPGVRAAISLDILILRYLAVLVKKAGKFNTDLQAVVDEWASSLFREMDYKSEANNGVKFKQLYGGIQDVLVPEMYVEQTTRKILIMQWVEGQKLSEVKDLYMIEIGVYCSFNQLLEYGFYHADPHPGNLLRTYDGKLAYIDFGMMGEFKQELRDGFIEACLHLVNRDYDALAKDFVTLGLLPPTADKDAVTKALTGVFRDAVARGVSNISFGDLLGNLGTTMYKFKFRIPSYFSLVIRSLAVLEGIAISFNPNYKVLGSTYPWIARKVLTDTSPRLQSSLRSLLYKDGMFNIERLESLITESLRAKTERALIKKQVESDNSRMVIKQILFFTLDEKGAFVREILLEEFAKGLDALGLATLDSVTRAMTANIPFTASGSFSSMTNEDITNLQNLRRLLALISGVQETGTSNMGDQGVGCPYKDQRPPSNGASLVPYQFQSFQEIIPLLSIVAELPQETQQQLLRLPADLAAKLVSRVTARTIRRAFL